MCESAQIHDILATAWHPSQWREVRVLVAVSGGPDSVALLRCLLALSHHNQNLHVAHFNHRWRGAASDADARFVTELCAKWNVPVHHGAPPTAPEQASQTEDSARKARLAFLESTAAAIGARYLATGHTADDQAETILHRVIRGTGLAGLAGIQAFRPLNRFTTLVRPFLQVQRHLVLDYLETLGQPYRDDQSNFDRRYTRARLRHELLPQLESAYNANAREAICRLGALAGEAQAVVRRLGEALVDRAIITRSAHELTLDCTAFQDTEPYLIREAFATLYRQQEWPLQAMSYDHWVTFADLATVPMESQVQHQFPNAIQATRSGKCLHVRQELAG